MGKNTIIGFCLFLIFLNGCDVGSGGEDAGPKSWGAAMKIDLEDRGNLMGHRLVYGEETAMAVWLQSDGTRVHVWARQFDGTRWRTGEMIDFSSAPGDASMLDLAMDGEGRVLALWKQSDGAGSSVWANYFDGDDWGAP